MLRGLPPAHIPWNLHELKIRCFWIIWHSNVVHCLEWNWLSFRRVYNHQWGHHWNQVTIKTLRILVCDLQISLLWNLLEHFFKSLNTIYNHSVFLSQLLIVLQPVDVTRATAAMPVWRTAPLQHAAHRRSLGFPLACMPCGPSEMKVPL